MRLDLLNSDVFCSHPGPSSPGSTNMGGTDMRYRPASDPAARFASALGSFSVDESGWILGPQPPAVPDLDQSWADRIRVSSLTCVYYTVYTVYIYIYIYMFWFSCAWALSQINHLSALWRIFLEKHLVRCYLLSLSHCWHSSIHTECEQRLQNKLSVQFQWSLNLWLYESVTVCCLTAENSTFDSNIHTVFLFCLVLSHLYLLTLD